MEIGYFIQSPKNPIFHLFCHTLKLLRDTGMAAVSMEESPLGEYLVKEANNILVGHLGHKATDNCEDGLIPTDDEIHNLIECIKTYLNPKHYCICKEDPDDYSHIHFYVHHTAELTNLAINKFRINFYKMCPRFKRSGKGGKTPFTMSRGSVINREFKYPILNDKQQKLLKICYQVKYYSETEYFRDEETPNEQYKLMEEMYWKLKAIIQKHTMSKVVKEKKTKVIRDRIKIFFESKVKFKKEYGPLNQSPDLLYVVDIVCQFYETDGKDLPHTTTCIERYSLMLLADYNPEEHKKQLIKYMHNKFKKEFMI